MPTPHQTAQASAAAAAEALAAEGAGEAAARLAVVVAAVPTTAITTTLRPLPRSRIIRICSLPKFPIMCVKRISWPSLPKDFVLSMAALALQLLAPVPRLRRRRVLLLLLAEVQPPPRRLLFPSSCHRPPSPTLSQLWFPSTPPLASAKDSASRSFPPTTTAL